jgi:UDP-N-acetylmuramate--alanine ligase
VADDKSYFFVGIGGSGMMPLATILAGRGARVAGSDRSLDAGRVPAKFDALRALGVALHPQDGSGITSADQLVVASAAVEDDVADLVAARQVGATVMRRPQLLAELFNASALPIGVAGTSGKSTVTGMIGWILHACGCDPTVMNGAVMTNFARADAPFASALVGRGDAFVSEVDESDGSIALYRPRIAVLNNVSRDHKEMAELRELFGGFVAGADTAVINLADPEAAALAVKALRIVSVAVEQQADYRAVDLSPDPFAIRFTLLAEGQRLPVRLAVPGAHNVANALAALVACVAARVPLIDAVRAIEGFTGLKRRFELVGTAAGVTVLDDFGHNPDKIAATLATLRAFPGRLLILFQPHGYGPLRQLRHELAEAFAAGLAPNDLLVIPDPAYFGGTSSREVGSGDLAADIRALGRDGRHLADREAAAALLVEAARPGDRVVVMGARDDTLGELARRMLAALAARGGSA